MTIHIDRSQWLPSTFAQVRRLCDVLRNPAPAQSDLARQTQLLAGEVARVLGSSPEAPEYSLIMKFDQTIGWVENTALEIDSEIGDFLRPPREIFSIPDFFENWKGTPYLWGGITSAGIDCSGLTQRFYIDLYGRVLPRNSYNQRKGGRSIALEEAQNGDLIFVTREVEHGRHHVGIFFENQIWHASWQRGVVCDSLESFLKTYELAEVITYRNLPESGSRK